jgi:hypothetical protein
MNPGLISFFNLIREISSHSSGEQILCQAKGGLALCKEKEEFGGIIFDHMQNLPLPKIPVQEMFYLKKLWLYVFCIHDMKTDSAEFYTCNIPFFTFVL